MKVRNNNSEIRFNYTSVERTNVINTTAQVAHIPARIGRLTGQNSLSEKAKQAVDGSWTDGEEPMPR